METITSLVEKSTERLAGIARETRPGQIEMTRAVAEAIERGTSLIAEAPTGTGKSFAYLIPAVSSHFKVVIATATKALQDQLAGHDLPFLATRLGGFTYAVLKGRGNYMCLQALAEATGDGTLFAGDHGLDEVLEWAASTSTGDINELARVEPEVRSKITVTADQCPGARKCPRGDDCWAERAKHRARSADVVVVNMALYGNDLASGGQVLPEHAVVVFDECHRLEDGIAEALGAEISTNSMKRIGTELWRLLDDSARPMIEQVQLAADDLGRAVGAIAAGDDKLLSLPLPDDLDAALGRAGVALERALNTVETLGETDLDGEWQCSNPRAVRMHVMIERMLDRLRSVSTLDETAATFVDGDALKVVPLDVADALEQFVWSKKAAILTSATVPINIADRLGATDARRISVDSPFDFEHNALIYLAKDLPPVNDREWGAAAYPQMMELINAAGGRTLGLFSSYRAMRDAADAMRRRGLRFPILTQDDGNKASLIERFRDDEAACLFATQGFYEGVDVPGRTLSLVIIDRIPFPHRNDPLMTARSRAAGQGGWFRVDMPRATTLLTQAAGRLIRTSTDRGVVAILDNRLKTKWESYGHRMTGALPPMSKTGSIAEAVAFLRQVVAEPEPADEMTSADIAALVGVW